MSLKIIAYTYEADVHCIACTRQRFHWVNNPHRYDLGLLDSWGIPTDAEDAEGNLVHPLFSIDEWQELDPSFLAENPTQYLECRDCDETIDEYTVCQECGEHIPDEADEWYHNAVLGLCAGQRELIDKEEQEDREPIWNLGE